MRELKALHEGAVMVSEKKVSLWKSHDAENLSSDHMQSILSASVDTLDVSGISHDKFTDDSSCFRSQKSFNILAT